MIKRSLEAENLTKVTAGGWNEMQVAEGFAHH